MVISLLTLLIFMYQTHLLREQSRLSVKPRLTFSKNIDRTITLSKKDSLTSTKVSLSLSIRNDGLGPAIIESNKVVHQNREFDILTFFDMVYPKLREYGVFNQITDLKVGGAIPVSQSVNVFSYFYDIVDENKIKSYLEISDFQELPFNISVVYSSMYQEKWMVTSNEEGHPRER